MPAKNFSDTLLITDKSKSLTASYKQIMETADYYIEIGDGRPHWTLICLF